MFTLYTFGDSILDCGWYNDRGIHPGQLLVRNDDEVFPEFAGRDLRSRGDATLVHRALDGATVDDLPAQARGMRPTGPGAAIVTIGGNDLLAGLVVDHGPRVEEFARRLSLFVESLPIRPVVLGNVYDPTFGDDALNFLGMDPALARRNHHLVNAVLAASAGRHRGPVDLHAHFLQGDPSWFTRTIEPSLTGASEVRRCFLPPLPSAMSSGSAYAATAALQRPRAAARIAG